MRNYEEKVKALKEKMLSKIEIYKSTCRMRIAKADSKENIDKYIIEYHYLIILEQYLNRSDAFNEKVLDNERRLDKEVINKLLSVGYDPVWNYLVYMDTKYRSMDMINLFNNEIFTINDMPKKPKEL